MFQVRSWLQTFGPSLPMSTTFLLSFTLGAGSRHTWTIYSSQVAMDHISGEISMLKGKIVFPNGLHSESLPGRRLEELLLLRAVLMRPFSGTGEK